MYDSSNSVGDGKIESSNLTKAQKNYAEVLSHLARIAKYVEMRNVVLWVEKPNGYQEMLDQIGKDEKVYDNLTPAEKEQYERKYRYEKIKGQRLGGAQIILQHMIIEAHQDPEIKKLWGNMLNEVKLLASRESTDFFDGMGEKDLK